MRFKKIESVKSGVQCASSSNEQASVTDDNHISQIPSMGMIPESKKSSKRPGGSNLSLLDLGFNKKPKESVTGKDQESNASSRKPESPRPFLTPDVMEESETAIAEKNKNVTTVAEPEVPASASTITSSCNDIAFYIDKPLSDRDKFTIFEELGSSEPRFQFPYTLIGDKNRSFQISYLSTYTWLCYSKSLDAAFCKFCFVFQKGTLLGQGSLQLSNLATKGYRYWKKATDDFNNHGSARGHLNSCVYDEGFLKSYKAGADAVSQLFKNKMSKEAEINKLVLTSIIRVVVFLAKQNLPFRGHHDFGRIEVENDSSTNEGNFREMLKCIARYYDDPLRDHFEKAGLNAMYTSPRIRNELIEICGNLLLRKKILDINAAKCFSVIADETTDASTKEQLTICIRHVSWNLGVAVVNENFIGFVQVTDLSGEGLSSQIVSYLLNVGLDLNYLRGQTYDGAAAMNSDLIGVKTRIQNVYPQAIYTYCSNHCLNLVISFSCKGKRIRNAIGVVKEVINFFSRSTKRTNIMRAFIEDSNRDDKIKGLLTLCETRWVERHDAIIRFCDLYVTIVGFLEKIEDSQGDRDTKVKAGILMKSMCSIDFILSLHSCAKLLSISHSLSAALQNPQADLQVCYEQVNLVTDVIRDLLVNAEFEFHQMCESFWCVR